MRLRRFYISLFIAFGLFTFFLSPIAAPGHAHGLAYSNPITVTSRTNTVHFPTYIDLQASANDPVSTINRASIVIDFSAVGGQEIHPIAISKPGNTISVSWREDTTGGHFVPPGTRVDYFWEFWDSAGNTLTDTQQQFTTIDTRFSWHHLTQGLLQVNWYEGAQDFGHAVLTKASTSVQKISTTLGGGLLHPINLWVYANDQDFHDSLAPGSYEWVGGEALPTLQEASIVAISTSDDTLKRDMPHELTHLIFHQLIENGTMAPTWFDEGLAVYNQEFHEGEMIARFNKALASQSLLRLATISSGFPANADQAYLAYAQSWNLVTYMYDTFHQARMAQLIKLMGDAQTDFNGDLQRALGVDEDHLENQWRLHLGQPAILTANAITPTPQPTIQVKQAQHISTNFTTFWLLIGLGVLLVLISLICLVVLVIYSTKRNKALKVMATVPTPANWHQGNQAITYPYPDPSTYMHTSMYAQPPSQPESPYQGQEYPGSIPERHAPQE
jgi:peptidase MA superfamily protein